MSLLTVGITSPATSSDTSICRPKTQQSQNQSHVKADSRSVLMSSPFCFSWPHVCYCCVLWGALSDERPCRYIYKNLHFRCLTYKSETQRRLLLLTKPQHEPHRKHLIQLSYIVESRCSCSGRSQKAICPLFAAINCQRVYVIYYHFKCLYIYLVKYRILKKFRAIWTTSNTQAELSFIYYRVWGRKSFTEG
jgi:hypothetical protein